MDDELLEFDPQPDYLIRYCPECDEEYDLPEDLERCPLCDSLLDSIE